MLTDMENSKKTLEEELQKTSEVSVCAHTVPVSVSVAVRRRLLLNVRLSSPESLRDRGGEHPAQDSPGGCRGRRGTSADQQRRAGLRGGDPAAGS